MKHYSDLTEVEQYIIHEYNSWSKSTSLISYKLVNLEYWMKRAIDSNIHGYLI